MPSICECFGITIYVYYNDHDHAPPHFHAEYAEHEALFLIETLEVYSESLPPALGRSSLSGHPCIGRNSTPIGRERVGANP